MANVKERPIIFSTDMVRAILEGKKTQTRRVMKPQPITEFYANTPLTKFCPYGQVGDRLWVRETWQQIKAGIAYKASWDAVPEWKWRSPIFMPRWASRITLEIIGIRVERLQEITHSPFDNDCHAEGFNNPSDLCLNDFMRYWDLLNAKRGYGWETNPWVWIIEFNK